VKSSFSHCRVTKVITHRITDRTTRMHTASFAYIDGRRHKIFIIKTLLMCALFSCSFRSYGIATIIEIDLMFDRFVLRLCHCVCIVVEFIQGYHVRGTGKCCSQDCVDATRT